MNPALTPEEWAKWTAPTKFTSLDRTIDDPNELHCRISKKGTLVIPDAHFEWAVTGRARHALAALALHGQPFGFTREDVALVLMPDCCTDAPTEAQCNLAAKIAALLPPEGL